MIWKDGCTYDGQFEDDQMNGKGTFKSHPSNGNSDTFAVFYDGHLENGKPAGYGKVILKNFAECEGLIEHGVCRGSISDSRGTRQGEITLEFPREKHNLKTG